MIYIFEVMIYIFELMIYIFELILLLSAEKKVFFFANLLFPRLDLMI